MFAGNKKKPNIGIIIVGPILATGMMIAIVINIFVRHQKQKRKGKHNIYAHLSCFAMEKKNDFCGD